MSLDCSQAVDSGILLLRDFNQSGLPLLHNTTALDTDSTTDASATQSSLAHSRVRRPHKYESIDDFSKPKRRRSSSSLSRDATPPLVTNVSRRQAPKPQVSTGSSSKFSDSQRIR